MVERAFWPVEGGGRPPSTNGERINESDGRPQNGRWGQTVNEWGTNQRIRPRTADGRRQVVVGRAFQPVRQWTADRGMDGGRTGFLACRGRGQTVNEWGTNQRIRPRTADGRPQNGRWGQTVNEWGTNQRIRPRTADGRPRNGRW